VALCQARTSTKPLWGLSSSNPYHPSHVPNSSYYKLSVLGGPTPSVFQVNAQWRRVGPSWPQNPETSAFAFLGEFLHNLIPFISVADPLHFGTDPNTQIRRSVPLNNGSGSCSDLQDAKMFGLLLFEGTFTSFFKDKKSILLDDRRIRIQSLIRTSD
jgi:hypothetical protein